MPPTIHEQMLEGIRHELIISLVKRQVGMGRELTMPVSELESTAGQRLMIRLLDDKSAFVMSVEGAALSPRPSF